MRRFNRHFMRNRDAGRLLELFIVTAAASVLAIRFLLAVTGYPSLRPGNLHIAHVLLGGVVMMIALIISLGFINKSSYYLVAVLGGFGFGAFIDELGKFITGDNDYFYRPAVALIYITFVLIYLGVETFVKKPSLSTQEKLVNVLEIAKDVVLEDLDHQERKQALQMLRECPASDPVTRALRDLLYSTESIPVPRPDVYTAAKYRLRRLYGWLVKRRWFVKAFIAFFVLQSASALLLDILLVYVKLEWKMSPSDVFPTISFFDLAGLFSATLAAGLVVAAAMKMRASRLSAYGLFKDAVVAQILLVQVFLFYRVQFLALLGLAGNIVVLLVLQYMIRQEKAAI
ncbi:MAG TPA: hypothetical protein PLN19_06640 [Methanothrix sp.]|nr:hypothetical protein [Methanothrix sp.]HQE87933.1 hypothetical protein [Methanothrix sp.]HQI68483.1 hypothetical protein [Methanothrix sp.]HRS85435.1 hypothetical protein [Methanothrix sp.]